MRVQMPSDDCSHGAMRARPFSVSLHIVDIPPVLDSQRAPPGPRAERAMEAAVRTEREILALNAFGPHAVEAVGDRTRRAVERRLRSFGTGSVLFYSEPIEMVRAEGVWMEAA